jgi:putative ABC transport system permease protein
MTYRNSLSLSWKNVRSNRLRTTITVIIMALGIFALIMIITAIQAASNSLTSSFSTMGANSFGIRYRDRNISFGGGNKNKGQKTSKSAQRSKNSNNGIPISYDEARLFKERYNFPSAKVGIALRGQSSIVVNNSSQKTNPDVNIYGGDENYLEINGYKLAYGRNFTLSEIETGQNVCMLGSAVADKLFPVDKSKAIETIVNVNHIPYRVIGVLEEKNSSAFFNTSRIVITSYNNIRRLSSQNANYNLAVMVSDPKLMDIATGEAKGVFRPIRKLTFADDDNFYIDKSDSIAEAFLTNLGFLEKGTMAIAFITLIGAAIGLMNIMLVAVSERTREIGLTKALGGTKKDIRSQFLFESLLISLMGAVAGIIGGILIGNLVAVLLHTGFVVPWIWVIIAVIVCSLVGLAAGLYPAYKASDLDPIVALRYE